MTAQSYLDAAMAADAAEWADSIGEAGDSLHQVLDRLACVTPWSAVRGLAQLGVPGSFLCQLVGAGDIALAGVDLSPDGNRFAIGGPTHRLIMAVRGIDGTVVDLLALSSTVPDEWALLHGASDFLGERVLAEAEIGLRREVRLRATPLDWLRAAGDGTCALALSPASLAMLRRLGAGCTIVVDPGHRQKMQALLAHGGLPLVSEDRRAALGVAA